MAQKFTVPITVKQLSSAGSDAVSLFVDGDTNARLKLEAGGKLVWGSGSATGDVNLYRDTTDTLKTDDDLKVGGKLSVVASSGDEGGEIFLAQAATNTTLDGGITIDSYQNKIRFFEQGGSARGAYIDLTACAGGAGTNLLTGGGGATTLDGLNDVTAPSPTSGDYLKYNGSAWVNDPINLGTDTTGDYVASLVAGTNVTITNNSGEGATPTIAMSGTIASFDSISTPDWIQFDTSVGSPNSTEGRLQWDSDYGTLSFGLEGNNSVQQIGINQFAFCYNADSVTLTKGTPVYIFGGQGSQVSIKRANNSGDATSARTLGLVSESIASGASGYVCTYGVLAGLDTSAYTVGDILYLGATDGAITTTAPTAPNHYVFIGVVIKADVGGEIWVRPQNGYELKEIHDVQINAGTLASGDFLKYNGTLWVNDPINLGTDTTGNYMVDLSAGTGVSITHTPSEGSTATVAIGQAVATTDSPTFAGLTINGASVIFEGATADNFETTLTVADPTADRTITLPDATGTVALLGSIALGSDTTGNYISDVSAGTGITITHTPGEGSTPTIAVTANTYQPLDSELTALAALTSAADKLPYFTGAGTANTTDFTTFGRSLVDDADSSAARTTLGLAIGTDVQAYNATLAAVAGGTYSGDDSITTVGTIATGTWNATEISVAKGGTGQTSYTDGQLLIGNTTGNTLTKATLTGTANQVTVTNGSGSITLSLPATINVDTSGNAATATKLATARTISLTGDVTGSASFDGSGNASIAATIASNSVALGTDTTGNYMVDVNGGTGVTVSHTAGEGSTATVSIGQAVATTSNVTFADIDSTGKFTRDGNRSAAAWGVNGVAFDSKASTYTNTSTAASGTAPNAMANSFGIPTIAATNSNVTVTNSATVYIAGIPVAGTNVTLTNRYALYVNAGSIKIDDTLSFMEVGTDQSTGIGDNNTTSIGVRLSGSGAIWASRNNGTIMVLNRMQHTAGGVIVEFRTNGAAKGTITENAGTVSYNAFLGSHYTEIDGEAPLRGTVMESTGVLVDGWLSDQSRLPKCKVSDTASSTAVFGIYFGEHVEDESPSNGHLVASLGAAWVRMTSGSMPALGDLIESNGDGCARVQEDTIIRSSTIGKLSSTTPAETYEDGSYLLPCVLYCG